MAELEPELPTVQIDMHLDPTGAQVVILAGELDSSNADSLQEQVALIPSQPPRRLIFDLTDLRFMDSAGIAVLINATAKASSVSLCNPSPIIRRVLEATGLSSVFAIEP
jgi:anti-anti-sigma factor